MKTVIRSLFVVITMAMLTVHSAVQAEIAVIANSGNPEITIKISDAKRIFLGKRTSFPGGAMATAVDQPEGEAMRDAFYQKLAGKNAGQMKAYWSKLIFSGKATPPEAVVDDAAVKTWVASHKEGIGYIDGGAVDGSVKVLLILP